MYKYWCIAATLCISLPAAHAQFNYPVVQCISGDCFSGEGVANLENFHVYRGTFKNSKPEGKGMLLKYSQDSEVPEYIGEFKNGAANGNGVQLIETNSIYAEGVFAEGYFTKGEIHFSQRFTAKVTTATKNKDDIRYSGTLYEGTQKTNDFSGIDIYELKEKTYGKQTAASGNADPNLTANIAADMKKLTTVFESKFDITDRMYNLYLELLDCLPDDTYCAINRNNIITEMIQLYTEKEAMELDVIVHRLAINIATYRSQRNISAQQRKDAGEVMKLFDRLKDQYLDGFNNELVSNIKKAVTDSQNEYGKAGIAVMRTNARLQNNARKESRQTVFDLWKTLTALF